ncbi:MULTISPECIES: AMP-binding protein [unclassified Moraxella]|uniref:AMP-binding protein n=1 Tax=unclassified Moraxella TaxID=2685852 RepID=UPI003AF9C09F
MDKLPYRPWHISYERYQIKAHIDMPRASASLLDMLEHSFASYPDRTAYIFNQQRLRYAELDRLSQAVACYLHELGLVVGDKVGIMLPNVLQYPIIVLGVIRAGMVVVGINPNHTAQEIAHQLTDADAKAVFVLERFVGLYQTSREFCSQSTPSLPPHLVICRLGDLQGVVKGIITNKLTASPLPMLEPKPIFFSQLIKHAHTLSYQRPTLNLTSVALLQYTSGTTDTAKGVILSHGNILANILQIDNLLRSAYDDEPSDELILCALPLYHVFSFSICCMLAVYRGFASLLIANPKDNAHLIKQLQCHQPSVMAGVNPLFHALLQNPTFRRLDFSRLKATIGGGMSTCPHVAKKWHQVTGMPIIEGYGLSETSPVVTFNPLTIAEFTNKIGIPAPATDVLIVDANDQEVPIGERGEIIVKGPQVMQGYHNLPQATAQAFTRHGYLRTGDIGIMDERGFIKIVDRKKDMMVVSGFNVYPTEIETAMLQHPQVAECVAIGIPSATRGEEPKIFVVRQIVANQAPVSEAELIEFGKQHLTGYKRPRHVSFVDELPKSPLGKVLRKELRKREGLE